MCCRSCCSTLLLLLLRLPWGLMTPAEAVLLLLVVRPLSAARHLRALCCGWELLLLLKSCCWRRQRLWHAGDVHWLLGCVACCCLLAGGTQHSAGACTLTACHCWAVHLQAAVAVAEGRRRLRPPPGPHPWPGLLPWRCCRRGGRRHRPRCAAAECWPLLSWQGWLWMASAWATWLKGWRPCRKQLSPGPQACYWGAAVLATWLLLD